MRYVVKLITNVPSSTVTLCEYCGRTFSNVLFHHGVVCPASETERERMWDFINNYCDVQFAAYLHGLEDINFVHTLLGVPHEPQDPPLINTDCHMLFLYRAACFLYKIGDKLAI